MSIDTAKISKELEAINTKIKAAQDQITKAEGRFEEAMEALKRAGFNSIEDAKAALQEKEASIEKRKVNLETAFSNFVTKYNEAFGINGN